MCFPIAQRVRKGDNKWLSPIVSAAREIIFPAEIVVSLVLRGNITVCSMHYPRKNAHVNASLKDTLIHVRLYLDAYSSALAHS